jgi:thiamine kinase
LILAEALVHVPGYAPGIQAVQIAHLAGGNLNRSYSVLTAAGRYVLRLSPAADAWLASDRSAERELHTAAAAAGIAPRIVHADPDDRWLITEYTAGPLWTAAEFSDPYSLGRLADLLRRLHALPAPVVGRFDLLRALDGYVQLIEASGTGTRSSLAGLLEKAAQAWRICGAAEREPALVHHDLHGSNIIESERGLVLIDWECAAVTDPLLDVACLLSYYPGAREHAAVLLRYSGLERVTTRELQGAVWLFDLHTYLWYRERRLRLKPTHAELEAERRLLVRLAVAP